MSAPNPWDGSTLFPLSCAMSASQNIRRGEILVAQEIADDLRHMPNTLGSWFAAQIIEDEIARHEAEREAA